MPRSRNLPRLMSRYIADYGWWHPDNETESYPGPKTSAENVTECLVTVPNIMATNSDAEYLRTFSFAEKQRARELITEVIRERFADRVHGVPEKSYMVNMMTFNDHPATTKAQVRKVLAEAGKRYDAEA